MTSMQPMDEGMAQERTLLSWRRTALTLSVASFALARLALSESVALAELFTAIALVGIAVVVMKSARQYKGSVGAAGISTFIVAMTVFLLGMIEILLVLKE